MSSAGCADSNPLFESIRLAIQDNITTLAGGGQAAGPLKAGALPAAFGGYRVTTVASSGDSVTLPPSQAGQVKLVTNAAASNSMNVFPAAGETINALGVNNAFAVAANKCVLFICTGAGQWHSVLTS
jgi:hypothetical protein